MMQSVERTASVRRRHSSSRAQAALLFGFIALSLILQLPGSVPFDGITVWYEAETGRLYAQHPPALVLIWKLTEMLARGPALFAALQLSCLWLAAGLLIARFKPALWQAGLFYLVLLAFPPLFAMTGMTVKDVFGAHLVLLAFVLALPAAKPHSPSVWLAAFAAATLATLLRYQFALILIVLMLMAVREVRHFPASRIHTMLSAVIGMGATWGLVALGVAVLFTRSGSGDVAQSLRKVMIFDIAGVVAHQPVADLPVFAKAGVGIVRLKDEMRRDYSPVRVDTLWQVSGEGVSITARQGVFGLLWAVPDKVVSAQWREAVVAEPGAFLRHRLAAFGRLLGFGAVYECRPLQIGISWLPKGPAAAVRAGDIPPAVSAKIMQNRHFPVGGLFRAWLYAAACLAIVAASRVPPAVWLAAFGLVYEASFFLAPQACEVRYSYPLMLAAVFAAALWRFALPRQLSD